MYRIVLDEQISLYYPVCVYFLQVVVLSRIIPDREPAISSAEGIKTLMNCLEKTTDDDVRALAADCIARLAHTRAGLINIKSGL